AAVSGGDPIKTGFTAFFYSMRTALLPFLFIFNTDLLLIDVTFIQGVVVFIVSLAAMLIFAAGTQGYFMDRSKWYESAALLLIAFTLFRPGFWLDMVEAPYQERPIQEMYSYIDQHPTLDTLRMSVEGENLDGRWISKTVHMPLLGQGDAADRLLNGAGIELREEEGKYLIDNLSFGSYAEQQKLDFDWEITQFEVDADRPAKEWFFIPAFLLVVLVAWRQRKRKAKSL
ncbi:MAG: DUF3394 domain-containing protein, partial [Gammaproteobacteria bacterium]|nr:DUF3394 domain-containing protein [Gammaproteobacteria bacterium]